MALNTKGIKDWHLLLHNKNAFSLVPKSYGNEWIRYTVDQDSKVFAQYELMVEEVTYITRDNDYCLSCEESETVNIDSCSEDYVSSKINCTLPWNSDPPKGEAILDLSVKKHCITSAELELQIDDNQRGIRSPLYISLMIQIVFTLDKLPLCVHPGELKLVEEAQKIYIQNEDMMFNSTGCMACCRRNEFYSKAIYKTTIEAGSLGLPDYLAPIENYVVMQMYYPSDRFIIKEEYYTYDTSNLIAEFGGYLGLLLGYNVLGFYDASILILERLVFKFQK